MPSLLPYLCLFAFLGFTATGRILQVAGVETDCVNGTIFTLVEGSFTFQQAKDECALRDSLNDDSVLAAVRNKDEFDRAIDLAKTLESNTWVGIEIKTGDQTSTGPLPSRYSFVSIDQSGIEFVSSVQKGELPWGISKPSNDVSECVQIRKFDNGDLQIGFDDQDCTNRRNFLCSASCVDGSEAPTTTSPSSSPIFSPSTSPTSAPTTSPATSPSTSPSTSPIKSPTQSPSISAPVSPTTKPTTAPSGSPTRQPTKAPFGSPTTSPTNQPSPLPTTGVPTDPPVSPDPIPSPTTTSPTSAPVVGAAATGANLAMMIGIVVPMVLILSLLGLMVVRRNRRNPKAAEEAESVKLEDTQKNDVDGRFPAAGQDVSGKAGLEEGEVAADESTNSNAGNKNADEISEEDDLAEAAIVVASAKKNEEMSKPKKVPNVISKVKSRKQQEAADEAEFEFLMANNGKRPPSEKEAAEASGDEINAILSSSPNDPNFVQEGDNARPDSVYLQNVEKQKHRSIFRPSSLFLSKAKRDKAMAKTKGHLKRKKQKKKDFDIDNDI